MATWNSATGKWESAVAPTMSPTINYRGWSKYPWATTSGAAQTGSTASSGSSAEDSWDWTTGYEGSENPWNEALQSAYNASATQGDGTGMYTEDWNKAVAEGQSLIGKDYTAELNALAQQGIDQEWSDFMSSLGAMGMRELSLREDVTSDWSQKRADASTQAAIDAQDMATSALAQLTETIAGAGDYELAQIASDLSQVEAMITAATAGASSAQEWEQMIIDMLTAQSENESETSSTSA